MDRKGLEKRYKQKLKEQERGKLGEMFSARVGINKPLTDEVILEQNKHCGELSL